jgi:hypothetical protein
MKHANEVPPGLDEVFAQSERMVGRRIVDEYLLVPIVGRSADVEAIYTLSPIAAFIWERLDGRTPGETIVRAIAARYDVEDRMAAEDYRTFLSQLQSIQAVVPAGAPRHNARLDRSPAQRKREDKP